MMSTQSRILAGLAVLAAIALAVFIYLGRVVEPRDLTAHDNLDQANTAKPRDAEPGRANVAPPVRQEPTPKARLPEPEPELKAGDLRVRARITLNCPRGIALCTMIWGDDWRFEVRFTGADHAILDNFWSNPEGGILDVSAPRAQFPLDAQGLTPGTWSARIAWSEDQAFTDIAAPAFDGRVLDFGTIALEFTPKLAEDQYFVVGRVLHTSGRPIHDVAGLALRVGPPEAYFYALEPREDGAFGYTIDGQSGSDFSGRISLGEDTDEPWFVKNLPAPKPQGRVLDFGEIVIDCAAVEITVSGWPDDATRLARRGIGNEPELAPFELVVWLSQFENLGFDARVHAGQGATLFVPAGPYRWSASTGERMMAFAPMAGTLELAQGKLAALEIKLQEAPCLLVTIKTARPVEDVQLVAEPLDELPRRDAAHLMRVNPAQGRVAVANPDHKRLRLTASHRLFKAVCKEVAGDAAECTLELTEPAGDFGTLVVLLPELPEALKMRMFSVSIRLNHEVKGMRESREMEQVGARSPRWGEMDLQKVPQWDIECGSVTLVVNERQMGYPNFAMCGPVEALIEPGKTTTVRMPVPAAPPWEIDAKRMRTVTTCEGKPVSYFGPVSVNGSVRSLALGFHDDHEYANGDYAIVDGNDRYPMELNAPTAENHAAYLTYDFPARIRVRVTRGKELFKENVFVNAETEQRNCHCCANGNGEVALWLPRGKARLSVSPAGLPALSRDIVVGEQCSEQVFELAGSIVHFEWETRDDAEASAWLLYKADGDAIRGVTPDTLTLQLEPGRYRALPLAQSKLEVAFELPADTDLSVHMPFVAALDFEGSMIVPYPKEMKPDPDGYELNVRWCLPLTGDIKRDLRAAAYYESVGWGFTGEGIRLRGLPVNAEFVLALAIRGSSETAAVAWVLPPQRMKLETNERQTREVKWQRGVVLSYEWGPWVDQCTWTAPEFEYPGEWLVLPAGDYSLNVPSADGPRTFRLSLTFTEGKFFEMPPDVKKALVPEMDD